MSPENEIPNSVAYKVPNSDTNSVAYTVPNSAAYLNYFAYKVPNSAAYSVAYKVPNSAAYLNSIAYNEKLCSDKIQKMVQKKQEDLQMGRQLTLRHMQPTAAAAVLPWHREVPVQVTFLQAVLQVEAAALQEQKLIAYNM